MELKVLQWNARSAVSNKDRLLYFLHNDNIHITCLQESWFKPDIYSKFAGYNVFSHDRDDGRAGCAVLVRTDIPHRDIKIDFRIDFFCKIIFVNHISFIGTIYCIYCSRTNFIISENVWQRLLSLGNAPIIICGDFNAHNTAWVSISL